MYALQPDTDWANQHQNQSQRREEQPEEDKAKALLAQEAPHQLWVSPMTVKYARPAMIRTRYVVNMTRMPLTYPGKDRD